MRKQRSHSEPPSQPQEAENGKTVFNDTDFVGREEASDSSALEASKPIEVNSLRECFSKSIDQLGSEKLHVRIGGIYALETIAKDSATYHWTIMEYLADFIRANASRREEDQDVYPRSILIDIQTALTVIGRRDSKKDPPNQRLNLRSVDIRGANLNGANLQRVDLYRANLQRAVLFGANLQQANLPEANFKGAFLDGANLEEAWLDEANLQGANLSGNFYEANASANLKGAILLWADLRGANLKGVKNLELEQIKSARGDSSTSLPENLTGWQEEIFRYWQNRGK